MIPRYFWAVTCATLLLLSTGGGCNIGLDFWLKMTSCACFLRSGVKLIFHWNVYLFIFAKSPSQVLLSWITENEDESSSNSLGFKDNLSDKSLIYVKNNNGSSMETWETPAQTSGQSETCVDHLTKLFVF